MKYVIIEMLRDGIYEQHHYPCAKELDMNEYQDKDVCSLHVCANEQDQERMGIALRKMRDDIQ